MKRALPFLLLCFFFTASFAQKTGGKSSKKILYVCRLVYKQRAIDDQIKHYLDSIGYQVTLADESEPVSNANSYGLVIISSTVSAAHLGGKYADVKVPLITWENDIQDDMRFTGRLRGVDFGGVDKEHYIWIVNAPHPVAGGIPAGKIAVYLKDKPMGWGKPGLGASIIATIPGQPDKAVIYSYEKGATMDYDFLAPERRVMLFLDNTTFPELNPTGLTLFTAAVKWAIEK